MSEMNRCVIINSVSGQEPNSCCNIEVVQREFLHRACVDGVTERRGVCHFSLLLVGGERTEEDLCLFPFL